MTNTRIGERLANLNEVPMEDRSDELPALTEKYRNFIKGFKPLEEAFKKQYDAMKTLERSQVEVLSQLALWSKNSPLGEEGELKLPNVQNAILKENQECAEQFMSDVVSYVHEWEIIVTTRVDTGLKQAKELRQSLDHYTTKVTGLEKQRNAAQSKQKELSPGVADKLQRNEEKLVIAQNEYKTHVTNLCNLIEEAVECCWKDVHPLVFRMMSLEQDRIEENAAILKASGIVDKLKAIAEAYDIDLTKPPPVSSEGEASSQARQQASVEEGSNNGHSEGEKENADANADQAPPTKAKEKGTPLKEGKPDSLKDEDDTPKKEADTPSKAKERGEPLNEV